MDTAKKYVDFYKKKMWFSCGEGRATDNPFFSSMISEDTFNPTNNRKLQEKERELFDKFPFGMKILYSFIEPNIEPILDKLFFFSSNEIQERYDTFELFFDFGTIYVGMGHIIVLSFSEKEKKFFFREDGGANDWERIVNYERYKDFDPSKNDNIIEYRFGKFKIHQLYTFDEILDFFK